MNKSQCPKCNATMQEGFILEEGEGNQRSASVWVEGMPEPAFWMGLKLSDRASYKVMAYRCTKCGLLEFYTDKVRQS